MKLKTVVKFGTMVSVLLFCIAVGYYAFMKLDMANRHRDVNLFTLIPDDCTVVLQSDDISACLDEFSNLNYERELERFQFKGLLHFIIEGLNQYATENAHGLNGQMNRLLVSFHAPYTQLDQVVYFQTGTEGESLFVDMLREYMMNDFLPKEEEYRGETIRVYPLNHEEYLSVYTDMGALVISYQKSLVEKVIDARLDGQSLGDDDVFSQLLKKRKAHFLTLYAYESTMPVLDGENPNWSEYDFHFNSDVFYLTGDIHLLEEKEKDEELLKIRECPLEKGEGVLLSANVDSTQFYMEEAFVARLSNNQTLFDECMANLSNEASFSLVADMQAYEGHESVLNPYLPSFVRKNAALFSPFILSLQYSLVDNRLSHIWTFTYKH
ncbi:MAG: hypothetical protein IKW37_05005 [Bacteroidaceae bacterium]|nr:hypothetical protein [Bacteroidaceae bacterium]